MKINPAKLFDAYEQATTFVSADETMAASFALVKNVFEEKKRNPDACIMIYGVYNAGKSTLINVLLGRDEAAVGDVPLTNEVSTYRWGNYSILDTPGVDAPIKHENVTKEQMLKADAIIFVVDPLGTIEEAKTLQVMVDLLQARKQVFLVFNDKKGLTDEDFIRLKDQTRERLQQIAIQRGIGDILKDVPIVKINAQSALKARLEKKSALLDKSGYPLLSNQLNDFLLGISADDVYGNLKHQLVSFLNEQFEILGSRDNNSEIINKFDGFLQYLIIEKSGLSADTAREIEQERSVIKDKVKRVFRTSPDNCESRIEEILKLASENIQAMLSSRLQDFISIAQVEINSLQAALPQIDQYAQVGKKFNPEEGGIELSENASVGMSSELLMNVSQSVADIAGKPENVVSALKTAKEWLPSLMKGIGPKTMDKWASTIATKYVPYVGILITAGQALWSVFSEDPEEKAQRQNVEAMRQARERAEQQMDDFAQEAADGFERFMRENLTREIDEFFSNIKSQVVALREGFNEAERFNSQRLEQLVAIRQLALSA